MLRSSLVLMVLAMTVGWGFSGPGMSAPKVLRKVAVEYSEEARAKGMRGTVILSLVVNAMGRAEQISVIRSEEFELGECAMRALALWEFVPGKKGNKPFPVKATVEMDLDATRK
jgi:TonB family protein